MKLAGIHRLLGSNKCVHYASQMEVLARVHNWHADARGWQCHGFCSSNISSFAMWTKVRDACGMGRTVCSDCHCALRTDHTLHGFEGKHCYLLERHGLVSP